MVDKATVKDQTLIDLFNGKSETLTVESNVATLTYPIGNLRLVEATAGNVTGGCNVILNGTVATKEVKLDRTAKTLTFFGTDAVTECYVEYTEGLE